MPFPDEIKDLLKQYGIPFSSEDYGTHSVLYARRANSGDSGPKTVKLILIPLISTNIESANRQSLIISPLAGQPDTIAVPEDRWRKAGLMMKGRILAHLGIFRAVYARDCEIRKISREEAGIFLEQTHSYGGAKCRYCYGVFLKRGRVKNAATVSGGPATEDISPGTLIAAAAFSNARRWNKGGKEIRSYEWIRYASLPDIRINGGMGKVLKRFTDDIRPDDIMSYADLEWSDGQAYRRLGFEHDGDKEPVTFAVDTATWKRIPLRSPRNGSEPAMDLAMPSIRYFRNFGSRKYRLKLYEA